MTRRLLDYGESAVLLECADLTEALSLVGPVAGLERVVEVVPGARTLLLRLSAPLSGTDRERLLTLGGEPPTADDTPSLTVDVHYDGEDLAEVAKLTGLSPEEVVATHTGQLWTVGFCGFAPGFGYLQGEHDRLRVPRRSSPRTRVPAGAVGLADRWSGIYPRSGPGGWQLIGRTDTALWDLDRDPPALLQPGVRLQFRAI
ncbi:allophanate hydrolase subunit 1 [uncultured Friedmanniella sp.]|uniref:5-oxoprolinase subunit B family protein n=1 Tax=uncultured Friedmanniella sp. TaxID=335381 RepID=UPI0035CC87BE